MKHWGTLATLGVSITLLAACSSGSGADGAGTGGAGTAGAGTSTGGGASTSSGDTSGSGSGSGGAGGTAGSGCTGGGAFCTGDYPDLFETLLGKTDAEVQAKVDAAFQQLFHGDPGTQAVYFEAPPDEAYIQDIANGDVRSEGMSYGMMIAVQLDRKDEFDRLYRWAKNHMQFKSGPAAGYFSWQVSPSGQVIGQTPASDGEEYLATALLFASGRWGDGAGALDYRAEAQAILDVMLHKEDGGVIDGVTNMFAPNHQVVFVPYYDSASFTDPSYHLPAFYELWGEWASQDNAFWKEAAATSRAFFKTTVHEETGLAPDYANFDGTPNGGQDGSHGEFRFDAWRVASNVAVDYLWFEADGWEVTQSERLLDFFASQGISTYGNQYTLSGTQLSSGHSPGLVAMNAVAGLAASPDKATPFVQALWDLPIPSGQYRYYDGLLYLLGLLHVSGNFRIYAPG